PNMVVAAPMDELELRNLMYTSQLPNQGPFVIRYPRGRGVTVNWKKKMRKIPVGKGRKLADGDDIAILTIGTTGIFAKEAIEKLKNENVHAAHYDMRFVKPLDHKLLNEIGKKFNKVITVEDGTIMGGFGSAVMEYFNDNNYTTLVKRVGVPDKFIEHGNQEELQKECGFDTDGIVRTVRSIVKPKVLSNAG
ncbi:MAG: transketolase C-terminal domain-containing protein, partial [Bacteroidota bacterium]